MTTPPTYAVGDTVMLRHAKGVWVIVDHYLVTHEFAVRRTYGQRQHPRIVSVDQLLPVRDEAAK